MTPGFIVDLRVEIWRPESVAARWYVGCKGDECDPDILGHLHLKMDTDSLYLYRDRAVKGVASLVFPTEYGNFIPLSACQMLVERNEVHRKDFFESVRVSLAEYDKTRLESEKISGHLIKLSALQDKQDWLSELRWERRFRPLPWVGIGSILAGATGYPEELTPDVVRLERDFERKLRSEFGKRVAESLPKLAKEQRATPDSTADRFLKSVDELRALGLVDSPLDELLGEVSKECRLSHAERGKDDLGKHCCRVRDYIKENYEAK